MLLNSQLYLILDKDSCYQGKIINVFRQICKTGIDLVQLRENKAWDCNFLRDAETIRRLCKKQQIAFLVNNRLDIAKMTDADGLHLGQTDLPLNAARRILGKNKIIGISCHNLVQALEAEAQGADYISIGPVFCTKTKPDLKPINSELITVINQKIKIPFFAIGGINHSNIKKVISYGARRVALCRAICHARNAKKAALELRRLIKNDSD